MKIQNIMQLALLMAKDSHQLFRLNLTCQDILAENTANHDGNVLEHDVHNQDKTVLFHFPAKDTMAVF